MVNFKFLWDDDLAVSQGVLLNYFSSFKDPIRPQEVCRASANPTHPIFQLLIWLWLYADRCVYCRAPFKRLSVELFPPPLTLGIHRDAGLAGRAAVSIISVTCPARQPAALPVIRLGFILGLKILDSIWLSADHRASPSPDKPQPLFLAVTQSRPKLDEFVCKSFFSSAAVK